MELLDAYGTVIEHQGINWKKYSEKYFPFKIRQRDGDDNTLGILKFIFPNKFDIYLHDTNGRHLFSKEKRALSHGCIRVKQAKKLAANLIDCCVINFNSDSLNNSLKNKQRKKVDLFIRVPVHIRYFTAEVDSNKLFFYNDIYGLDKKMLDNLLSVEK
jgi:murein L,D-transpeptidase YcbB/YkuD